MGLVKGVNSNASVSEADEYFATRVDNEAWFAVGNQKKASALVTATGILDGLSWIGVAMSATQTVAFPRKGQYFDPRLGMMVTLDGLSTPQRVITATCELALHLLNNEGVTNETGGVDSLKLGTIELREIDSVPRVPAAVTLLVQPLLVNNGAATWWRRN